MLSFASNVNAPRGRNLSSASEVRREIAGKIVETLKARNVDAEIRERGDPPHIDVISRPFQVCIGILPGRVIVGDRYERQQTFQPKAGKFNYDAIATSIKKRMQIKAKRHSKLEAFLAKEQAKKQIEFDNQALVNDLIALIDPALRRYVKINPSDELRDAVSLAVEYNISNASAVRIQQLIAALNEALAGQPRSREALRSTQ